jgi:hypothetical protein
VAVGAGPCTCAAGQSYSPLSVSEPRSRATAGIWHTGRQSTRAVPRGVDVGVVGGSGPSGPVCRPGPRWENPSTGPGPTAFGPSSERAIDWGYRPPAQASAPDSWPDLAEAGAAPSRPSRAARGPECGSRLVRDLGWLESVACLDSCRPSIARLGLGSKRERAGDLAAPLSERVRADPGRTLDRPARPGPSGPGPAQPGRV